ncbi:MAG: hypothetical protein Q9166_001692 [cf. Caloplaca sp. 2 TL-2023]
MDGKGKNMTELPAKGTFWELPGNAPAELWTPTTTDTKTGREDFKHETRSDRELGWRGETECIGDLAKTEYTSQHALNTVFAAFEIFLTRTSPPPPAHFPFLVILLALYLALAYLTHATAGFYPYLFLDPSKGSGKLAGYILGILAAACVIIGIVCAVIWIRKWLTESKFGMHGKFAKPTGVRDEEMMEMTSERMK